MAAAKIPSWGKPFHTTPSTAKNAATGMVTLVDRPSNPSVMFTAFTVPTMIKAAQDHVDHPVQHDVGVKKRNIQVGAQMALRPQQAQKRHRRRQLQQELLNGGEAGVAVMLYLLIVINIADDAEYQGKQVYIDMGKVPLHHALPAHNHHRDADADDEHQPAHSGGTLLGHVPGGANLLDALSGP